MREACGNCLPRFRPMSDMNPGESALPFTSWAIPTDSIRSQSRRAALTTKLEGPLKRELLIGGHEYTLTLSPTGLVLALKGRRNGLRLGWVDLVSGEAALATALNASLGAIAPSRKASRASAGSADGGGKPRGGTAKSGK